MERDCIAFVIKMSSPFKPMFFSFDMASELSRFFLIFGIDPLDSATFFGPLKTKNGQAGDL